jgi:anti-sigma B factor antagonist
MSGELDLGTVTPLRDAARAAAKDDYRALVFDLSRLDFIDSTGLHVLVEAHRAMLAAGRESKVVCSATTMLRIFELTGLSNVLDIVGSRDEALSGYALAA